MGDFIGFTFNGVHSAELGITRVSSGDRYDEDLAPDIKDITAEVPGMDGEYYFGSQYGTRPFSIAIAYDGLTEWQLRKIKQVFNQKHICELIFDEAPYKKYLVKVDSPIELSYVCFDEPKKTAETITNGVKWEGSKTHTIYRNDPTGATERIYKGEGTISLVGYYPFAKSVFKQLPSKVTYPNLDEWAVASKILSASSYASVDKYNNSTGKIKVYNAGDVETGFQLYLPKAVVSSATQIDYKISEVIASLKLTAMTIETNEVGILIDTSNGLILGISNIEMSQSGNFTYTTSGQLYNRYMNSGYFFKLQPNLTENEATIEITGGGAGIAIMYDYLYF